jgi:hypothetical protein
MSNQSPVEQAVTRIAEDLHRADAQVFPTPDVTAAAMTAAHQAVAGLRAVLDAMADLEPAPALIINAALRAGLKVDR